MRNLHQIGTNLSDLDKALLWSISLSGKVRLNKTMMEYYDGYEHQWKLYIPYEPDNKYIVKEWEAAGKPMPVYERGHWKLASGQGNKKGYGNKIANGEQCNKGRNK